MKLNALVFSLACIVAAACAQASEEKAICVVGIVSLEAFPGRPNYESIRDGDEAEKVWILTVAHVEKKERFQLIVLNGPEQKVVPLRQFVGRQVVVEGSIWEAHSGHHHTPLLISVRKIKEASNSDASPALDRPAGPR